MAKMSTTTKVVIVAVVVTGTYFVARSVKAKYKKTDKKALLPGSGDTGKGTGKGGKGKGKGAGKAPPFPEENVGAENVWVDQIYGEWAGEDLQADGAAIQDETLSFDKLTDDLTDIAFIRNYPTWTDGPGKFPDSYGKSTEWSKWANAWNRMNKQMVDLVSQALTEIGV